MPSVSPAFRAQELYRHGDFAGCLKLIEKHCEELGAEGWFLTGLIYATADKAENGVAPNAKKASAAYRRAAELGHAAAARELGKMYGMGSGISEDLGAAARWLSQAAKAGDGEAAYELAELYYDHEELPDSIRAIELYEQASSDEAYGAVSLVKLGRIFCRGKLGMPVDVARGAEYLARGGARGSSNRWMDLAHLYYTGTGVRKDLAKGSRLRGKARPAASALRGSRREDQSGDEALSAGKGTRLAIGG